MSTTITTTTDDDIVAALLERAVSAFPEVTIDGALYSLAPISDGKVGLYCYDEASDDHLLVARVSLTAEVGDRHIDREVAPAVQRVLCRLPDGDVERASILPASGKVLVHLADAPAVARLADLLDVEPTLADPMGIGWQRTRHLRVETTLDDTPVFGFTVNARRAVTSC